MGKIKRNLVRNLRLSPAVYWRIFPKYMILLKSEESFQWLRDLTLLLGDNNINLKKMKFMLDK